MSKQTRTAGLEPDERSSEGSAFNVIGAWLDANDWGYQDYPDKGYYSITCTGNCGSWRVIADAQVFDDKERVVIYSVYPIRVPENKRSIVSELVSRINYGMSIGNFEMDFNDGEIRMKTSIALLGTALSDAMFDRLFSSNIGSANRYLSAIYGVAFGDISPKLAVEVAERPLDQTLQ